MKLTLEEAQQRAATSAAKEVALLRVMETHGLTLPRNAIEWRYGGLRHGTHTALGYGVRLLATDGVVAWFLLGDDVTTMFGHLSNFEETKEERSERPASKPASRAKSKRQLLLESL
jgi:hypothetical protein